MRGSFALTRTHNRARRDGRRRPLPSHLQMTSQCCGDSRCRKPCEQAGGWAPGQREG